ncbi:unnamed protein product, partial [Laminaria digitata]
KAARGRPVGDRSPLLKAAWWLGARAPLLLTAEGIIVRRQKSVFRHRVRGVARGIGRNASKTTTCCKDRRRIRSDNDDGRNAWTLPFQTRGPTTSASAVAATATADKPTYPTSTGGGRNNLPSPPPAKKTPQLLPHLLLQSGLVHAL